MTDQLKPPAQIRDLEAAVKMTRGWATSAAQRPADTYGRHPLPVYGEAILEVLHHLERALAGATPPVDGITDEDRDERLVDIYLAGFVSGAVHLGLKVGVAPTAVYLDASHAAFHVKDDPIARAQLVEAILVKWLTGETPPATAITAYGVETHGDGS